MRCETESQNFMTMYAVGRGGLMHYGFIYMLSIGSRLRSV